MQLLLAKLTVIASILGLLNGEFTGVPSSEDLAEVQQQFPDGGRAITTESFEQSVDGDERIESAEGQQDYVRPSGVSGPDPNGAETTACSSLTRPAILTGSSGSLTSPNYPSNYGDSANCQWRITAASSTNVIRITFSTFNVESNYDFVRLYDGTSSTNTQLAQLTGAVSSGTTYTSTGSSMFVMFTSDGSVVNTGFSATYTAVVGSTLPPSCLSSTRPLVLTGTSGTVTSPYYPSVYVNNADCQWRLTASSSSYAIRVTFTYFNTESGNDFVQLYDGTSSGSGQLASLSGSSVSGTSYTSSGSSMFVRFTSNNATVSTGFSATYTTVSSALPAACSLSTRPLVLTGTSGTLTSQNYPSAYGNNADCQWRLTTTLSGYVIRITFSSFSLESGYDYVRLYDGTSSTNTQLASLTGTVSSGTTYTSSGSSMFVTFTSDFSIVSTGFSATYTTVSALPPACTSSTRPLVLTGTSGTLTSPNYPSAYANNADCQWRLTASSSGYVIRITFTYFSTESGYDFVQLYDGTSSSYALLISLSGSSVSGASYTSSGSSMFVRFTSNSATVSTGFSATYTAISSVLPTACSLSTRPLVLTGTSGTLTSQNYPSAYGNNADCQWRLTASSSGYVIRITFSSFNVQSGYDYVRLYDGTSSTNTQLASLTGTVTSGTIYTSSGSSMFVRFTSDGSIVSTGFSATYTAVAALPAACSSSTRPLVLTGTSGTLTSPNYPSAYVDNADCQWRLTASSSSYAIRITFNYFNTESGNDFVQVYDGTSSGNSQLVSLSGSTYSGTSYTSSGSSMFVWFTSNSATVSTGFSATYTTVSSALPAACSSSTRPLVLTGITGTLTSQNYPSAYGNNADCQWRITTTLSGYVIRITFFSFNVENGYDYVRLYDGTSSTNTQLASLTGAVSSGTTYMSSGSSMFVRFTSDGSIVSTGFSATYTATAASTCPIGSRLCTPLNTCITSTHICDRVQDCPDDTDEVNCTCLSSQYQCQNGRCLSRTFICDGVRDCPLGDDESATLCPSSCTSSQFQCVRPVSGVTHQCITSTTRCDGTAQCSDYSDEYRCVSLNTSTSSQLSVNYQGQTGYYICADGWTSTDSNAMCQYLGYSSAVRTQNVSIATSYTRWLSLISGTRLSSSNPLTSLRAGSCSSSKAVAVQCSPLQCGSRSPNITSLGPYIIGGQYANRGAWPWQVRIETRQSDGLTYTCGGSLINNRWILTAAHCVLEGVNMLQPSSFTVRLGALFFYSDPDLVLSNVDRVFPHPDYYTSVYYIYNDVALLRLSAPVTFTDTIRPICLPDGTTNTNSYKVCVATGFGRNEYNTTYQSSRLLQARLEILNITTCFPSNSPPYPDIRRTVLCLGPYPREATGVCFGDSGGPLACQDQNGLWQLLGVTSYITGSCSASYDANVQAFIPWIQNNIANNS